MAAITATVQVRGIKEMAATMRQLEETVRGEVQARALTEAGQLILDAARGYIHDQTGRTSRDLRLAVRLDKDQDRGWATVGGNKRGFILRFLEFGTRAHVMPRKARGLVAKRNAAKRKAAGIRYVLASKSTLFGSVVKHPGIAAQAPLSRALGQNVDRALNIFGDELWNGLMRAIRAAPKAA